MHLVISDNTYVCYYVLYACAKTCMHRYHMYVNEYVYLDMFICVHGIIYLW